MTVVSDAAAQAAIGAAARELKLPTVRDQAGWPRSPPANTPPTWPTSPKSSPPSSTTAPPAAAPAASPKPLPPHQTAG
jgi:hypothetical protein